MEAPSRILERSRKVAKIQKLAFASAIVVAVLIVVIVPPAVLLTQGGSRVTIGQPASVLLPLYAYPEPGKWNSIYDSLQSRPDLNFSIVINPHSGPGPTQFPSNAYISGIQNLSHYENVRMIGYVRTGWAQRNITEIYDDISRYSGWASMKTDRSIAMNGIFFDETPSNYSEQTAQYMRSINENAYNASGLGANRLIVHNPGTIIDPRLSDPLTNVTIVFENSYQAFRGLKSALRSLGGSRSSYCYLVHSLPKMSSSEMRNFIAVLTESAQWLFLTNRKTDYYGDFGSTFRSFVGDLKA